MCVALGNIGDPVAVPSLLQSLQSADTLVRQHAAWALGCIGGAEAAQALEQAAGRERDPDVREEIELAAEEATEVARA